MDEQITNAEVTTAADIGAASGENTGSLSGEELFEKYESGASIEELNEMLANSEPEESEEESGEEENTPQDGAEETPEAGEEAHDGAEETQETAQAENRKEERLFTQKDVDYLIGKKTSEDRRRHSALVDDLSSVLGVERSDVPNAVRRLRLEREAEEQGIQDKELYAKKKELEEQNAQLQQAQQAEAARQQFLRDVDQQVTEATKSIPGFDMGEAVENNRFTTMLDALYKSESTRDNAVELAYRAVFFDRAVQEVEHKAREQVIASVKSGQTRIGEGAAKAGSGAAARIEIDKLNDDQIADIADRVMRGEKITI